MVHDQMLHYVVMKCEQNHAGRLGNKARCECGLEVQVIVT